MNLRLANKVEQRYGSLKNRNTPSWSQFQGWIETWDKGGRHCEYCHRVIDLEDNRPPYSRQLSLDHRIPLCHGGDDRLSNLALVCNRCNLIKSTMREDTYRELLYYIADDEQLLGKMLSEAFKGRIAYKLERLEKAVDISPIDIDPDCVEFYLPPHTALFCPDCRQPLSAYFNTGKLICLHCSKEGTEKIFRVEEEPSCSPAS